MSVYYWVSAARDGAGQHSGGVYLRDPAVLSLLPDAKLSRELGGSVRMRFRTGRRGFANVARARTEHGVVKKLHDEAYKMIFDTVGARAAQLLDANDLAD